MKLHINTILALTLMVSASANAKDKEPLAPRAITMCTLVMKKSLEFAVQRLSTGAAQPTNGFLPTLNSVDDRLEGLYQKEIEARAFSLGRTIEQLPKDSATLMSTPDRPLDSEVETRYNIYKMRRQLDIVREHHDDETRGCARQHATKAGRHSAMAMTTTTTTTTAATMTGAA
ncbi:MAG: hypothetical protein HRT45_12370, partial [Bdellovibrionales bacterium]|nr:hypothetical protein [Bdellovibrionales bacterium]